MVSLASRLKRGQRVPQYQCGADSLSRSGRWSGRKSRATSSRSQRHNFQPRQSLSWAGNAAPAVACAATTAAGRAGAASNKTQDAHCFPSTPRGAVGVYTADITYEDLQAKFTMVGGLGNSSCCACFPYYG